MNPKKINNQLEDNPAISVNNSLAFDIYNNQNGMGYGLKTLDDINKDSIIIK